MKIEMEKLPLEQPIIVEVDTEFFSAKWVYTLNDKLHLIESDEPDFYGDLESFEGLGATVYSYQMDCEASLVEVYTTSDETDAPFDNGVVIMRFA